MDTDTIARHTRSITQAPYDVILDIQRALDDIMRKHEDDVPALIVEIAEVIDMEMGRRNAIRYAIAQAEQNTRADDD